MKAKMVRLKTICKGILLLILVAGCHKSNTVNTGSQDLFPNKIGDNWHYIVKDMN